MTKYTDLITSEHRARPKFFETVKVSTDGLLLAQSVADGLWLSFDLDVAIGDQLDVIGQWVGAPREINTPIEDVYFALDIEGVGFDEGYWKGPFDPAQGLTALPDDYYRIFIRAKAKLNNWDGTAPGAAEALKSLLPNNMIYVQDNQDMSISLGISGPPLDTITAALLTGGYLSLKPMAVRVKYFFTSLPPTPVFGFDVSNEFIGGIDMGSWGNSTPYQPSVG